MTHELLWDIFATRGAAPDALWFAFNIARRLTARYKARVRVFAEPVQDVQWHSSKFDAALWIQEVDGFDVLRPELAKVVNPASCVLHIFESVPPADYIDRAMSGVSFRHWLHLARLGEPKGTFMRDERAQFDHVSIQRFIPGDLPHGSGFPKDLQSQDGMRAKWQSSPFLRARTCESLGNGAAMAPCTFKVLVAHAHCRDWGRVLEAWKAQGTPVTLLVTAGPSQDAIAGYLDIEPMPGRVYASETVSVTFLQPIPATLEDEALWMVHLVMTSAEDYLHRAMQVGCPLVWLGHWESGPMDRVRYEQVADWYLEAAPDLVRRNVQDLADDLYRGLPAAASLERYLADLDAIRDHADQASRHMAAAPEIVDVMMSRLQAPPSDMARALSAPGSYS